MGAAADPARAPWLRLWIGLGGIVRFHLSPREQERLRAHGSRVISVLREMRLNLLCLEATRAREDDLGLENWGKINRGT